MAARWTRILPVLLGTVAAPAEAQEALVLSTGASRGFSHAGTLLALDSLGYDPDIVVGASMGAVVGALYAAGWDPRMIYDRIVRSDWSDLFKPLPLVLGPERRLHFPVLSVAVDVDGREVTRGFVADWRVNRLLTRLLFEPGAAIRGDLDRLPRRFRAVGADLATGQAVVPERGDLARIVRVSMGTPGFFAPVEWDGRLLTDGGVANYLPISVARDLGATFVVAADASRPDTAIGRTDPAALGGRAVGLLMRNAAPDTVADVMIEPDIPTDFSGAVFDDPRRLVRLGLEAGRKAPLRIRDHRPAGERRVLPPAPERLSALDVEVEDAALARMARRLFEDVLRRPFDAGLVLARVDRLYATGLVGGVWPRVERRRGEDVLVVRVDPLPRTALSAAAGYDNDRGGRIWAGLQHRLEVGSPAELTLAASLSDLDRWVEASLRTPSLRSPFAWNVGGHYGEADTRVFGEEGSRERDTRRMGGWMGAELRRIYPDWIAVAALQGEWIEVDGGEEGASWGPMLRVASAPPPGAALGTPTEVEGDLRFGDVAYRAASVRTSRGFRLPGLGAAVVAEAAATGGEPPPDVLPALGDRHAVPGLRWGEERGRGTLVLGLDLARSSVAGGTLRARVRGGVAADEVADVGRTDGWVGGLALEGIWSLPFGPILLGVGGSTRGDWRVDLNLGPSF